MIAYFVCPGNEKSLCSQAAQANKPILVPGEGDQAVDIQEDYRYRNQVLEEGLHPILNLGAVAGVGFQHEVLPAPANFVAAEAGDDQRTQRQHVIADDEIPEIKPGRTGGERYKPGPYAETQRSGDGGDEQPDAADDAALGTIPASHFAHAGQNVFEHGKNGGEGCEYHEQEEDGAPDAAAVHVVEHAGHGIKQQ